MLNVIRRVTECLVHAVAGIAFVQYNSRQAAAYAKQKLDGFEYPPGYRVAVRFYRGVRDDYA